MKTDDERSSIVICYEKRSVGLTVAIEIAGDNEVPCSLVLADGPLCHPLPELRATLGVNLIAVNEGRKDQYEG